VLCLVISEKARAGLCHLASTRFWFQERSLSVAGNRRPAALPFEPALESMSAARETLSDVGKRARASSDSGDGETEPPGRFSCFRCRASSLQKPTAEPSLVIQHNDRRGDLRPLRRSYRPQGGADRDAIVNWLLDVPGRLRPTYEQIGVSGAVLPVVPIGLVYRPWRRIAVHPELKQPRWLDVFRKK
jgi:hypothetical protein